MHAVQHVTGRNSTYLSRLNEKLTVSARVHDILYFLRVLKDAFRRAFDHDAFSVAKAAAYSSILTFFPTLVVLGTFLASSHRFDVYVGEICNALSRILPTGSATAVEYVRNARFLPAKLLIATSLLALWTASSAIVSWMEGFRKAYQLPHTWGVVKERLIACSLAILAGMPLMFATILVAFGSQIGTRVLPHLGHAWGPLVLLLWTGIRWLIAGATSIGVIVLIYHHAIPRTRPLHTVVPGAVVASGLWFAATSLFGWYLPESATEYAVIYGVLGVGIALLVWMYLVALIVLVGAEVNAIIFPRNCRTSSAA